MDAMADLAAIPHERQNPSRFVADVQIGGGSMHNGYPIMYYLASFLHELGHNHQKGEWTFLGTGEFTNYSLCIFCTLSLN